MATPVAQKVIPAGFLFFQRQAVQPRSVRMDRGAVLAAENRKRVTFVIQENLATFSLSRKEIYLAGTIRVAMEVVIGVVFREICETIQTHPVHIHQNKAQEFL